MNARDVKCTACGTINHNLNLNETECWLECIKCGLTVNSVCEATDVVTMPVFDIRDGKKLLRLIDG